jgi:hypothetical protein
MRHWYALIPALAVLSCSSSNSGLDGASAADGAADAGMSDGGSNDAGMSCPTPCSSGQVCVHPSYCVGPPGGCAAISPVPFCLPIPAACGSSPTCTCFPTDVCHVPNDAGLSGGACLNIQGSDLTCSNA